jgi:hypothetical protein
MAKVEYRVPAEGTYRVADGSNGALHVKGVGDAAIADDGTVIDVGGAQTFAYNEDGTISNIDVAVGEDTYRQTFTYTDGNLTGISAWTLVVLV